LEKYRYWILGASIFTILLAWGSNFLPLSDLFIDYVPLYNKFRAPSSILVVVELLFPLIAIIGLYRFYNDEKLTEEYKQKILLYVGGSVLGITFSSSFLLKVYSDLKEQQKQEKFLILS
jgi:hypothetical protein